jgi:hypothetical protein
VLERLLPVFNAALARVIEALGRKTASLRLVKRILGIASDLIEHKAIALRTRMPREPVFELFCRLEPLAAPHAATLGQPTTLPDYAGYESQLDHLSQLLARCILIWFEADPQGFQPAWEPKQLKDAPIRRRLASKLGYPRCAYFAA